MVAGRRCRAPSRGLLLLLLPALALGACPFSSMWAGGSEGVAAAAHGRALLAEQVRGFVCAAAFARVARIALPRARRRRARWRQWEAAAGTRDESDGFVSGRSWQSAQCAWHDAIVATSCVRAVRQTGVRAHKQRRPAVAVTPSRHRAAMTPAGRTAERAMEASRAS